MNELKVFTTKIRVIVNRKCPVLFHLQVGYYKVAYYLASSSAFILTTYLMRWNSVQYCSIQKNHAIEQYIINKIPLEKKNFAQDLQMYISDGSKFHYHIERACSLTNSKIDCIWRSFKKRSLSFLCSLYKTYVRPHLGYCVKVWKPIN